MIYLETKTFVFFQEDQSWSDGKEVIPAAKPGSIMFNTKNVLADYLRSIKSTLGFNYDLAVGITGYLV